MKARTLSAFGAAATPLILAWPSMAAFVGLTIEQLPMDDFPRILTFRVYAQFDGTHGQSGNDFVFVVSGTPTGPLSIHVRGGTFFQHPDNTHGGGDLSPDPAFCLQDPTVCVDTFVTIGMDTSIGDATMLGPSWPGFEPESLGPCAPCGWFIPPDDKQGLPDQNDRVLLTQLSTENGVGFLGTFFVSGYSDGNASQHFASFDTGCFADIDGDDAVGVGDLLVVIDEWGPCAARCLGDVTANGTVGILDLLEVLAHWGPCK